MKLNPSVTLDAQIPTTTHEITAAVEVTEAESVSLTQPGPALPSEEPSRSERLYEAYRLWAFTGR